ncbi:MAG: nucleotidyl transferase AbiEii/AbiGii toxin family protein [Parvularculaceae bacterium]
MRDKGANLAASLFARLRVLARDRNVDMQFVLRRYAIERLLARLEASPHRDRFVLKGAMLFTVWLDDPFRPTQDLDLLGRGDPEIDAVKAAFADVCRIPIEMDGMTFDAGALRAEAIRQDQAYGGVRVRTAAMLGRTRIPVQIDVGFGDVVTPPAQDLEFPPLLFESGPRLRAYPKETVIAEKLQAIIALGRANSRMKDFYDLLALSRLFHFDGETLAAAIQATLGRRNTPPPDDVPDGLSRSFAEDSSKIAQWTAFTAREPLLIAGPTLAATIEELAAFVLPPLTALRTGAAFRRFWPAGGPWREANSEDDSR